MSKRREFENVQRGPARGAPIESAVVTASKMQSAAPKVYSRSHDAVVRVYDEAAM